MAVPSKGTNIIRISTIVSVFIFVSREIYFQRYTQNYLIWCVGNIGRETNIDMKEHNFTHTDSSNYEKIGMVNNRLDMHDEYTHVIAHKKCFELALACINKQNTVHIRKHDTEHAKSKWTSHYLYKLLEIFWTLFKDKEKEVFGEFSSAVSRRQFAGDYEYLEQANKHIEVFSNPTGRTAASKKNRKRIQDCSKRSIPLWSD